MKNYDAVVIVYTSIDTDSKVREIIEKWKYKYPGVLNFCLIENLLEIKTGFVINRVKNFAKEYNINYFDKIYLKLHIGVNELFKYILELSPSFPIPTKKNLNNIPDLTEIQIENFDLDKFKNDELINKLRIQLDSCIKDSDDYLKIVKRLKDEIKNNDIFLKDNKNVYEKNYDSLIESKQKLNITKKKYEELEQKYEEQVINLSKEKEYRELEKERNKYNEIYLDYETKIKTTKDRINELNQEKIDNQTQKIKVIEETKNAEKDLQKIQKEYDQLNDIVINLQEKYVKK